MSTHLGLPPIPQLRDLLQTEFGEKSNCFELRAFAMTNLAGDEFARTKRPGIYVFWHEDVGYLKIGKSQTNASKRALEHVRDNTRTKDGAAVQIHMADMRECPKCHLVLVNLDSPRNMHWVLALEHYLENTLNPCIRSARNG